MIRTFALLAALTLSLFISQGLVQSQDLPRCSQRSSYRFDPRINLRLQACLEQVLSDPDAGYLGLTALAVADDGTLFVASPLQGEILRLRDLDGDGLPDQPEVVARGLTLPNALAWHDGALYIAAGPALHRLDTDGTLQTLVTDLPFGTGPWTGGLVIGPDERLYLGTGAACDRCISADPRQGAILSFALDGSDEQILARGFRYPASLAFVGDVLMVSDSSSPNLMDIPYLDELNRIQPGAFYGWPDCIGAGEARPDLADDQAASADCSQSEAPLIAFESGSMPLGLLHYEGAALPALRGQLLVLLGGSLGHPDLRGYELLMIDLSAQPASLETIIPHDQVVAPTDVALYNGRGYRNNSAASLNARGAGIYPNRFLGMAASPEGWLYLSAAGGRLFAVRPLDAFSLDAESADN